MKIQKKLFLSGLSLVLIALMTLVSCGGEAEKDPTKKSDVLTVDQAKENIEISGIARNVQIPTTISNIDCIVDLDASTGTFKASKDSSTSRAAETLLFKGDFFYTNGTLFMDATTKVVDGEEQNADIYVKVSTGSVIESMNKEALTSEDGVKNDVKVIEVSYPSSTTTAENYDTQKQTMENKVEEYINKIVDGEDDNPSSDEDPVTDDDSDNDDNTKKSDGANLEYKIPEQYKITYKFTDTDGYESFSSYTKTDKGLQFGDQIIYNYTDRIIGFFDYDKDENSVELNNLYTDTTILKALEVSFVSTLNFYGAYKNSKEFVKVGTEQIANRECSKYEYKLATYGVELILDFWVDNEYEICMKFYEYAAESKEVAYAQTFEVTEFKTSDVNLPCDDSEYTTQIEDAVNELFEECGGNWTQVKIEDFDTYPYTTSPIANGKKVNISKDFTITIDNTKYELSIMLGYLVVYEGTEMKYAIGVEDDFLLISESGVSNPEDYWYFTKNE